MKNLKHISAAAIVALAGTALAGATTLSVRTDKPISDIAPTMYGLFFEDINYAADGGLYGELVRNRSFEFPQSLLGWESYGNVEVRTDGAPFERNPHYVRLTAPTHSHKRTGLDNTGFFGIGFDKNEDYRFSVWARVPDGGTSKVKVELIDLSTNAERQQLASKDLEISGSEWKKYELTLRPSETLEKGRLRVVLASNNTVDLEHVSLFPAETFKGRENGMRPDVAQKLADLHPGVLRFPGGCIVEGTELADRYQWKNTVGPVENRPLNLNRWQYTFPHRFFPDYYQSYGLGFYEYFQFAEDIGAEPLPILNVGLVCQYQNDDPHAHVPVDSLQEYIQDAIDLVEFANGSTDTKWGKLRADMGHPEPFNLKYLGIGNEQWGEPYTERLEPFLKEVRKACPGIEIVGSSGPYAGGEFFDYLWPEMTRLKADLVDEHYYAPEKWYRDNAARYDSYSRKGPKVFAGEYACHGADGKKWNHFNASLLEAAYMTGLERNADIVRMATYAPLLAHVEGWQWRPDLVWYDNLRSFPTSSYYVQKLYADHKGTHALPATVDGVALTGAEGQNGLYASAVTDKNTGEYIVKVANISEKAQPLEIRFDGLKKNAKITEGRVLTLASDKPLQQERLVDGEWQVGTPGPVESAVTVEGGNSANVSVPAGTFQVYIFK